MNKLVVDLLCCFLSRDICCIQVMMILFVIYTGPSAGGTSWVFDVTLNEPGALTLTCAPGCGLAWSHYIGGWAQCRRPTVLFERRVAANSFAVFNCLVLKNNYMYCTTYDIVFHPSNSQFTTDLFNNITEVTILPEVPCQHSYQLLIGSLAWFKK